MRFLGQVAVNGYVGAVGEQGVYGFVEPCSLGFGDLGRKVRIVSVDFHADGLRHATDRLGNSAEADEPEGFSSQFRAFHGLLFPSSVPQ